MRTRIALSVMVCGLALGLIALLPAPSVTAQPPSANVRLVVVTGSDGTNNPLLVELFGPSDLETPLWRVVVAEGPGDLQPGQTNSYEFTVPVGFCEIVQFHLRKPASVGLGDDPWDIREYEIWVDGVLVAFDRVVYEYFSPQTVTSWPVNGNWQGTAAYQSRCGATAIIDPSLLDAAIQINPGVLAVLGGTPTLVPLPVQLTPFQPLLQITPTFTVPPANAVPTPAQAVTCPGFLPSRLRVGGMGRMTPGLPNNLRSQPSTNSPLIGQIPGGATFRVLAGPLCDPAGIAWWQVDFNGLIGWTGEGQGNAYWVEPVQ